MSRSKKNTKSKVWKRKDHIVGTIVTLAIGSVLYFMSSKNTSTEQ